MVKTNGIPLWARCTIYFRIYFNGDWDVHRGYDLDFDPWENGCGSKLNRRGKAGFGPCFHLPGFHFGADFLSDCRMLSIGTHWFPLVFHWFPIPSGCGRGSKKTELPLFQILKF